VGGLGGVADTLEMLDTLDHLGIEFVSFRENLDTGGPPGRAVIVIVSAVAEFERSLNYREGPRRAETCQARRSRFR